METDKINLDYVHANIPLTAVCVYKSILCRECGGKSPSARMYGPGISQQ